MSHDYDVIVCGASVAGSTAATLLAREGARVALLERRTNPAAYKTLCTHYIQPCGTPVLTTLGVVSEIESAGAVRNDARWYTRWGWIEPRPAPGGAPLPHGYNIRRQRLDPILRSTAAQTPGVDLLLGRTVTGLLTSSGRATGVVIDGPGGEQTIRAALIVGADGKHSTVARLAGVASKERSNGRFSYFAHFRNIDLVGGKTQCWFLDPGVAYAMPNDDGVTVIAVIPPLDLLPQFRADLEGSYLRFVRNLPDAPPMDQAQRVSKIIGAIDYPLVERAVVAPGVALIGDAALASDPLWGVGCGWALETAAWLAESVVHSRRVNGEIDLDSALSAYAKRHRKELRGHQHLIADYASGRRFNPIERLMFSAAARDEDIARHMHLFASRLIGALDFLSPAALTRAALVNVRHRNAARRAAAASPARRAQATSLPRADRAA